MNAPMKPSRNLQMKPPRLPADLAPGRIKTLEDEGEYAAMLLADCDLGRQFAGNIVFDQVILRHTSLSRARLPKMKMSDARLEACDLSGALLQNARWYRVELVGCRLTGFQLSEFNGGYVLFKDCTMDSAMFTSGRFKASRFENCTMRRLLLEKMDLSGAIFAGCDLTDADLTGSALKGVDFRGSNLAGVHVEERQLQGTIIDPLQAAQVATLLGITVKDPPDFRRF
jgi:uncharacterized protein YjbI with pentapeptide repeats